MDLKTTTAPEGIPLAFLERLPKHLADFEISNGLRIISSGLFVEESLAPKLLAAYQSWLTEVSTEQKNPEKLFRKLFGSNEPKLWYALDGKRCLPGFVVPAVIPADSKLRITRYPTGLLDCDTYLHPRDPLLATIEGVSANLSTHEGLLLEITLGSKKYILTEASLKQLVGVLRGSRVLSRKYPDVSKPLREIFPLVRNMLGRARPASNAEVLLIPEQFKGKPGITYLRTGGVVLIEQGGQRIVHAYEHRGKGRRHFISQEAQALTGKDGQSVVRGFDGQNPRKHSLGRVWSQKMSFHLEMRAFEIYFHQISRSRKMKERFMQRPTVRDVLQSFVPIFRQSAPVNELNILAGISRHRRPYAKYRKSGDWVFVITDKNIISSCVRLRKSS